MQRRELFRAGGVNIAKGEHVLESIFTPTLIPATTSKLLWVLEGAEDHIPDRNVGEVVGVMSELMVNAM